MSHRNLNTAECNHPALTCVSSPHATEVGFKSKVRNPKPECRSSTYPAPLVLPGDELSLDPHCPPQSLRTWIRSDDRNEVTPGRNVIYVAAPPAVDADVGFVPTWSQPRQHGYIEAIPPPAVEDVVGYLAAFYHGLPVKLLPPPKLCFTSWEGTGSRSSKASSTRSIAPRFLGLNTSTECIRIRTRASKDGIFPRQLNLDDLLDAAIGTVPEDGYALLLLVHHDLFEGADDEFVCGRAYGGSRVAVISTARYHPALDVEQGVEREHAWPASHCEAYVQAQCAAAPPPSERRRKRVKAQETALGRPESRPSLLQMSVNRSADGATPGPLQEALSAHLSLPPVESSPSAAALSGLWRSRVCRTASHELGHCFGIDHCVYYACIMQGSASLMEDSRQPPFLCPVDLSKVVQATGADVWERYSALRSFCGEHKDVHAFHAFGAWVDGRLEEVASDTSV